MILTIVGFSLFLVAFAMLFAGVGLLTVGETTVRGRKIPLKPGRWVGGIFVSFFPLIFLARGVLVLVDPSVSFPHIIVYATLEMICLWAGLRILRKSWIVLPKPAAKPILLEADDAAPILLQLDEPARDE